MGRKNVPVSQEGWSFPGDSGDYTQDLCWREPTLTVSFQCRERTRTRSPQTPASS